MSGKNGTNKWRSEFNRARIRRRLFGPPAMGRDFPRNFVELTPDEILWDPDTIYGRGIHVTSTSSGKVCNRPGTGESQCSTQKEVINDCPPPSQLPIFKRQTYLEPSRDAELLHITESVDVPPGQSIVAISFETWQNIRTFIRWIDVRVLDALDPTNVGVMLELDCEAIKLLASPNKQTGLGSACPQFSDATVQSPRSVNITDLPMAFHNILFEIPDRRSVQIVVTNSDAVADRRVRVTAWGWFESKTVFDNAVRR